MDTKTLLFGAGSGLILGLLQMLLLGGSFDLLVIPAILGAVIAVGQDKIPGAGFWAGAAIIGAGFFAVASFLSGYKLMDHVIMGVITGLLIAAIMKFVTPKLLGVINK